jgi:hypothetical protein
MLKPPFLCAVLVIVAVSGPASAPPHADNAAEPRTIDGPDATAVSPALLTGIVAWVSQNLDLPAAERLPQVVFLPPGEIAALRYRGFLAANSGAASNDASDIVAVYEPTSETIYLPEGWRETKPADMSVLVHEVTHISSTRHSSNTRARRSVSSLPMRRRSAGCSSPAAHCRTNSGLSDSRC